MSENSYFQNALSSMVKGAAYADAVKHMYDAGMSACDIQKNLSYPASLENVKQVIREYELEKNGLDSGYEYIQKEDKYGRRSFIRVKKSP